MPAHWARALLRAQLREAGYDAVGARDLLEALAAEREPGRPVRLILLDQSALAEGDPGLLGELKDRLLQQHPGTPVILLTGAMHKAPDGPWQQVLRRPVSIADIAGVIEREVPLPAGQRHPLD